METVGAPVQSQTTDSRRTRRRSAGFWWIVGSGWILALVGLFLVLPGAARFATRYSYLQPYRVSSESMCPTICANEKIVADMGAYKSASPRRGDVVVFTRDQTLFIKRVVGVDGDTVEPGPHNEVLVNGVPLPSRSVCGKPILKPGDDELPDFPATKVPSGFFFVVGDNLANSNDSRVEGFDLVDMNQVRGKALLIYWSPGHGRIGCRTQ